MLDDVCGEAGNDKIDGGDGADRLYGDACAGLSTLAFSAAKTADGNDTLTGGKGNDVLVGGTANDQLIDRSGTNTVHRRCGQRHGQRAQRHEGNDLLRRGQGHRSGR